MATMADIAEKNGAVLINEVPGISWRMTDANVTEKTQPSLLQRLFGLCEDEEEEVADCTKGYLCWTCGASYETNRAKEFLIHIRKCCKGEPSAKKTVSQQSMMSTVTGEL
jgi:hypothetical protein